MSSTFLQSKAAAVGEGCKYRRCFFCFTFYLPRMFFNSTLQPLLLKDRQKACFSSGFSKWAIPVSQEPHPQFFTKTSRKTEDFFFSMQFCLAEEKKPRSWVGSGDPRLDYFRPWGVLPSKLWETNRTGVRQICSLEGLPEDWGGLESPWEDNQGQESPNTRSRCPTLQMTDWGSNRGQFCH